MRRDYGAEGIGCAVLIVWAVIELVQWLTSK